MKYEIWKKENRYRSQPSLLSYIYSMKEKKNGNVEQKHWSGMLNKFNYPLDF